MHFSGERWIVRNSCWQVNDTVGIASLNWDFSPLCFANVIWFLVFPYFQSDICDCFESVVVSEFGNRKAIIFACAFCGHVFLVKLNVIGS